MEGRVSVLEGWMERADKDIYGNGRPGLLQSFTALKATIEADQEARKEHDKKMTDRLIAWAGLFAALIAGIELLIHLR